MSLKRFNDFKLESNKYSRIQTFGVISYMNMYLCNSLRVLEPELPEKVDEFFGTGIWEMSRKKAIEIVDRIRSVDIGYIEDRLQDLGDIDEISGVDVYVGFGVLDEDFRDSFNLPKNKNRILSSFMFTSLLYDNLEEFLNKDLFRITISIVLSIWESAPRWKREDWRRWRDNETKRTGLPVEDKPLDHKWEVDRVLDMIYPGINIRVESNIPTKTDFFKDKIKDVMGGILNSLDTLGSVWDKGGEFEYTHRFGIRIFLK